VNREAAERRGRGAETLACWYLRLHGWRILARRARVPGGEVDIVAQRLAPRYMRDGDDVRIDALFIVPRRWPRHLPNVWQG
jgi:putative endonuclease